MEESESGAVLSASFTPPALLPIAKYRKQLLYTIETYPVTVLIGETGSGKTTQLPQFLEQAGWAGEGKVIGVTQPRRVAAISVAERVAQEKGCKVGQEVGYSIRFEDVTSAKTRIKYLTDGLILREILVDPLLTKYSVIMVDEAHERSTATDLLIALLKKIMKKRPELRIIVSSATVQAEEILKFFAGKKAQVDKSAGVAPGGDIARVFYVEGRVYPVDIHYLKEPAADYLEKAIDFVFKIHTKEEKGDILVFLTGREDIDDACQQIADRMLDMPEDTPRLFAVPLYAGLPTDQQMRVFEPAPKKSRKVVVSTNIAEASVTIDGIVYVIDCGFVKLRAYNPKTGIDILTPTPVSKASALQRAGRAGRTKPGKCYRMWTEAAHNSLPDTTTPEIQRSNLTPTILQLKEIGVDNVVRFDYLTPPPAELLTRGLDALSALGALADDTGKLTHPLGTRIATLALNPMLAAALLAAPSHGCTAELLSIAAMSTLTSTTPLFLPTQDSDSTSSSRAAFAADEGDHLTLLNAYTAYTSTPARNASRWCHDHGLNFRLLSRAVAVRAQLARYLARFGIDAAKSAADDDPVVAGERIRRCVAAGYFAHAARMQPDGSLRTVGEGVVLHVHPSSVLFNRRAEWVVFGEVVEAKGGKVFIRDVSKVEREWLVEAAPGFYQLRG